MTKRRQEQQRITKQYSNEIPKRKGDREGHNTKKSACKGKEEMKKDQDRQPTGKASPDIWLGNGGAA